jgi:hypothetical protein
LDRRRHCDGFPALAREENADPVDKVRGQCVTERGSFARAKGAKTGGSVEGSAESGQSEASGHEYKENERPQIGPDLTEAVPFQQNAPDDPQEMGGRQHFPDPLRPDGHAFERELVGLQGVAGLEGSN